MLGTQPENILDVPLETVGNVKDISGDQTGNKEFYYQVPDGREADLNCLTIQIKCTSDRIAGFGSGAALENGLKLEIKDKNDNVLQDLAKGLEIKTNDDLLLLVDGDEAEDPKNFHGQHYYRAPYSVPIKLSNEKKIVLTTDDDFTTRLDSMHFIISGLLN